MIIRRGFGTEKEKQTLTKSLSFVPKDVGNGNEAGDGATLEKQRHSAICWKDNAENLLAFSPLDYFCFEPLPAAISVPRRFRHKKGAMHKKTAVLEYLNIMQKIAELRWVCMVG